MAVRIREILEKYPTKLNVEGMKEILLDYSVSNISLEDIKEPEAREINGEIYLMYRTEKNHIVEISQRNVGETWKDDYGYIHTFNLNEDGTMINT